MATLQIRVKGTGTVLFSFENPTGTGNPSGLKSRIMAFGAGGNTKELGWFSPSSRDGDTLVYSRNGRRAISLSLFLQGSAGTFDSLRTGVEALIALLEDGTGKEIYWQVGTEVRYLDFQTADISRVLDGSHEGSVHAIGSGKLIGYPLTIYCDPSERGASATFINALAFGVDPVASVHARTFTMTGNTPAPLNFTAAFPNAGSKGSEIIMASRTRADVADLVSTTGVCQLEATGGGWTISLSNDTSVTTETGGIPATNNVARVSDTTTAGVWARRVRATRTTLLDSLRGWERILLRCRTTLGVWDVQLRWGVSLADPAPKSNAVARHDASGMTGTTGYVEVDLGDIKVPEEGTLSGVVLEVWVRRVSGGAGSHLDLDLLRLLPNTPGKDWLTRIVVPSSSPEVTPAGNLLTPVTQPAGGTAGGIAGNGALSFDATTDNAGVPPNAGRTLPSGRHRFHFDVLNTDISTRTSVIRLRDITSNNDEASITAAWGARARATRTLQVDIADANLYQEQVDDPSLGDVLYVFSIGHDFIPFLSQNEQAYTEPEAGVVYKRSSSGTYVGGLATEGPVPFYVAPGLTALFVVPLDIPRPGYNESESVKARTVTVTAAGSPRYTG